MRLLRTSLIFGGAVFWLLALAAIALLLLSRSNPWLIGKQNEPHWSWAVGSGRFKASVAESRFGEPGEKWVALWYLGLDGAPIRWDVTLARQEGQTVIAIPLWLVTLAGAIAGTSLIWLGTVGRRRSTGSTIAISNRPH